MLTELVKRLEEKRAALEDELAGIRLNEPDRDTKELEQRLASINEQTIKGYKELWRTFTPPNPFPCPFCFAFRKKVSPLKPQKLVGDMEPFTCPDCREEFDIPVELF